MIRLVSGDLTLWTNDANPCGRTYPRLPHGIFGRIDDMFTIRGENVYPSEIDAALNELSDYGGEHRIVISREAAMDELLLRVEADAAVFERGETERFRAEIERKLLKVLGLRTLVEVAEPGSIPRTDFKARRVIDDRAVFREMHAQIEQSKSPIRMIPSLALIDRVKKGDTAAIARLISRAESGTPEAHEALARIYKLAGRAHVVGITGVPGSGKSTLVGKLAEKLRANGGKVGIVAIDPSSPYSGGAILGDRIRMTEMATDPGVYIRSMATRGATGGMARAALDAVDILDVAGFDTVILETVGVGQDEVEIVRASHTTVVVSAPGLGDEIQAIKAGILEIADIHVVSKCDRSDANRTLVDLKQMITLGLRGAPASAWQLPVIGTSAFNGQGMDELADAIEQHRQFAQASKAGEERRLEIARFRLRKTAENLLLDRFRRFRPHRPVACHAAGMRRDADPYALANELLQSVDDAGAAR